METSLIEKSLTETSLKNERQMSTHTIIIFALLAILAASVVGAVAFGSSRISAAEVYGSIGYRFFRLEGLSGYSDGKIHDIIWLIRMPRVILAIAVGGGLAVCGTVMQAVVRNPLADPYVLGVSSGASLGATMAILLGLGAVLGENAIGLMAFVGALTASFLVLFIANAGAKSGEADGSSPVRLVLAGMAVSAVFSAFSSFIIFAANDKEGIQSLTFWLMGSLTGADWGTIMMIHAVVVAGVVFFFTQSATLDLMMLGDDVAITLGKNLKTTRMLHMLLTAFMIGFIVSGSGMIGFVGLIVPHATRTLIGASHSKNLPVTFLTGAIFVVWADVASRIVIPHTELPIGILISMVGAPCFVHLLLTRPHGLGGAD